MRSSAAAREDVGPYDWDDFIALDEDDLRELIDGHLVQIETPTLTHEEIVVVIIVALGNWAEKHGGRVVSSGYKVRVSPKRGVMPDVQFYREGNDISIDQEQGLVRGRPDLVVEVTSPSSRRYDRIVKLNWYARLGIREYWIVDPEARMLERLVLKGGTYALGDGAAEDAIFRPPSFRGLKLPLSRLWHRKRPTKRKARPR